MQVRTEVLLERRVHTAVDRLAVRRAVQDRAEVRRARGGGAEPLVVDLRAGAAAQVVAEVRVEIEPVRGRVRRRHAGDEAVGHIETLGLIQRGQRILVLRTAALEVRTDVQPAQRVGLQDVRDRRHAREPEERVAAFLLVDAVLLAARVRRAEREVPVGPDSLIDVEAEGVPRKAVEVADRAFLMPVGRAGEEPRLAAEPAGQVDRILEERLRRDQLIDRVVSRRRPRLHLEPLAQRLSPDG